MTGPNGHTLVRIPEGPFEMGSEEFDIERPIRSVYVSEFLIDRYPVTNRQYAAFVESTGMSAPPDWNEGLPREHLSDHPVQQVSFLQAMAYADWVGLRLPREDEWEKAARGTDGRRWPWGENFDEALALVWDHAKVTGTTSIAVTQNPESASPYGIEQMAGNVEEWVDSPLSAVVGPQTPYTDGRCRVLRGGSWFYTNEYTRCAYRRGALPDFIGYLGAGGPGFRCASDVATVATSKTDA